MKKMLFFSAALVCAVFILSGCTYAHGDGPDVATPRKRNNKEEAHNPRKSNWLNQYSREERVGRKNINEPGGLDSFQVFPMRDGRRSERLKNQSSPLFWK